MKDLPTPSPKPPAHKVVQLVNCSKQTLLGAANASGQDIHHLVSVLPREKTWVMKPVGAANNANVLTIDVPPEWEDTKKEGSVAPNIWARTGCRYDISHDKAQCETGGAGGVYDISKAKLGPPGAATITEWTFYQEAPYHKDNFDISAVNGVSLNVDIIAVGGDPVDPENSQNIFWWNLNAPLTVHGDDLRANNRCVDGFKLKRSVLTEGIYGFVIVGDDGKPLGGDGTVACFSNCGKYKFPLEPLMNCDEKTDTRCRLWKTFCAGDPKLYGQKCTTDADCPVSGACWNNPGSPLNHTCQLRGFIANDTCDPAVCTFPYGYINPFTHIKDYSTQPPFGSCSQVTADDAEPGAPNSTCEGDDGVHKVFPHAYSWPNDPQVYAHDAPLYRVVFAPGGSKVPITKSVGELPTCSKLPGIYCYEKARTNCAIDIKNGAVFAIARQDGIWSCNLGDGAGNDGVICSWGTAGPPEFPCKQ